MMRSLLAVVVVLFTMGSEAWAQKRVAVAAIDGDRGGAVAAVVVAALDPEFKVIAPKAVTKAADELAIAIDDKQANKLMAELEADALVMGSVEKTDGGNKLTLRVISLGAKKSRSAWIIYGKKPKNQRVRSGIRTAVSTILASTDNGGAAEPAAGDGRADRDVAADSGQDEGDRARDDAGENAKPPMPASDDGEAGPRSDDDAAQPTKKRGGKGKVVALSDEDDDHAMTKDDRISKRSSPPRAEPRAVAKLSVGPSASNRSLTFTHRTFAEAPKDYENTFVPGARVQGEIYPIGFASTGFLSNLGIGFEFDQTFGLKVNSGGMELSTTVRNYAVDARFRLPLGNKASSPEVVLVGGYARRTFKVSRRAVQVDLPDVDYKMFNPGLAFRIPFGAVAVFGDGRVLLVTSAGQIQTPGSYGKAKITAFDAEAGLELSLSRRFSVRLAGDFTQIGYDFSGVGDQSNNRDQDATTVDVGGASERYIGGALTFAVAY